MFILLVRIPIRVIKADNAGYTEAEPTVSIFVWLVVWFCFLINTGWMHGFFLKTVFTLLYHYQKH